MYLNSPGVIRNGLPSIKIRKLEKIWNKISLTGCKWSNLSAPGETELIADSIPRPLNHGILLPRLPRKGKHDATTAAAPVRHAAVDADG